MTSRWSFLYKNVLNTEPIYLLREWATGRCGNANIVAKIPVPDIMRFQVMLSLKRTINSVATL